MDCLRDLQLVQMRILALEYKTQIMWCGVADSHLRYILTPQFHADAKVRGRYVTMNNRYLSPLQRPEQREVRLGSCH